MSTYYARNKDKIRLKYQLNKEEKLQYQKEYNAKNRTKYLDYQSKHYDDVKHSDAFLKKRAVYYMRQADKRKIVSRQRNYQKQLEEEKIYYRYIMKSVFKELLRKTHLILESTQIKNKPKKPEPVKPLLPPNTIKYKNGFYVVEFN